MKRPLCLLAFVALAGCSTRAPHDDPSTPSVSDPYAAHRRALALVAPAAAVQPHALVDRGDAFSLGETAAKDAIMATLPKSADGALHLEKVGEPQAWIDVRADGLAHAPLSLVDHALVALDVARDTDVVHVASLAEAEELRVLRSANAPSSARYVIEHGAAIASVRAREGRIEALDGNGRVTLSSAPMWAVDAHGVRRSLEVHEESGAFVASLDTNGLAYPIVVDPTWTAVASMTVGRQEASSVLLNDGRLFVTGGITAATCPGCYTVQTEAYDAVANTWTAKASMATGRYRHSMVVLANGNVFVTSGYGGTSSSFGSLQSTSEIYSVAGNSWSAAATKPTGVSSAYAARLADGTILVAGGAVVNAVSTVESYNPSTNTWTTKAPMKSPRWAHAGLVLPNGSVFVVGGYDATGSGSSTGEVYNPTTNTWTLTPAMTEGERGDPMVSLLPNGKVLVIGGALHNNSEIFDPATNTFSKTTAMNEHRSEVWATTLPSGIVVVPGGSDLVSTAELYDPVLDVWFETTAMNARRSYGSVGAYMPSIGKVVVAGGSDSGGGPGQRVATAEVLTFATNGSTCTTWSDCNSGLCVDGHCCNAACTGACQACDVAGSVGTCTSVPAGAPHGSRTCAPYLCAAGGSCASTCAGDGDCTAGNYCSGGHCAPKKSNGTTCAGGNECTSASCVDGVCCNVACAGECQACDVAGKVGTCSPVSGAPHGSRAACTGAGVGTACGPVCDGSDTTQCHYPGAATACGANACTGGVETHGNNCDGAGACADVPKSCGAYACGATTCKTSCTGSSDCAAGYFCKGGACSPFDGLGTPCTDASTCTSGFCTDGVCCGVATCGAGSSCSAGNPKGTCAKTQGTACTSNVECGSGFCVDGACCDTACTGQCQACDVAGSVGTCSTVTGAPHGGRSACDDGGGDACKARTCDGVSGHGASCVGYAGTTTTTCGPPAACNGSSYTGASSCDGSGACKTPDTVSCVPYVCDANGCKSACTDDTACADGFHCDAGKCTAVSAHCSDDGSQSIAKDGTPTSCAPYRCGTAGTCLTQCASSDDCASGLTCDSASKTCVSGGGGGGTGSGGGCAIGDAEGGGASIAMLSLTALIGVVTRRRRRRA